jgi:hypothetical protein
MPRPKGSVNKKNLPPPIKYQEWKGSKLQIVDDEDKYLAKNVYWLLNNLRKKLERDPLSVPVKEWISINKEYYELSKSLKKKRGYVGKRVDTRNVAEIGNEDVQTDVGGEDPFSVGSGV